MNYNKWKVGEVVYENDLYSVVKGIIQDEKCNFEKSIAGYEVINKQHGNVETYTALLAAAMFFADKLAKDIVIVTNNISDEDDDLEEILEETFAAKEKEYLN